jgi:hypothetical protein
VTEDAYGFALSTASDAAAEAFRLAADRLLTGTGDPLAAAEAAVGADAGFAMAHSVSASALLLKGRIREARESAERAMHLAERAPVGGVTRRERQHAAIVVDVAHGRRDQALAKVREHATEFPRDALAIDPAAGVFGLIGFSGRQDREAEQLALLAPLAPHYGDDWWYQHVLGFALLENDAVERALPLVESAVHQRPDSGHAAHTFVHGLFEAGAFDAGARERAMTWLDEWLPGYAPDGVLYCHLWWHLALFHLLRRDFDAVWRIYDRHCQSGQSASPTINVFTDGVSLAWRCLVAGGAPSRERLETLKALGEESFPRPGIFVDVHRAMVLAALGDEAALAEYRAECEAALAAGRLAAGDVVLKLLDGFAAYAAGDFVRALDVLSDAAPQVVRIGGSRAQRRFVSETLESARRRAG